MFQVQTNITDVSRGLIWSCHKCEKKLFWFLAEKLLKAKMTKVFTHVIHSFYSRANKTCSIINYSYALLVRKATNVFTQKDQKIEPSTISSKMVIELPNFDMYCSYFCVQSQDTFLLNTKMYLWNDKKCIKNTFLQCFYPCVLSFVTCIYTNDALAQNVENKNLVSLLSHKVGPLWVQKSEFN